MAVLPFPRAAIVLAHGAGAGMRHPFMAAVAAGLAARGIASLRYQFPYMEKGAKRKDADILNDVLDAFAAWLAGVLDNPA